MSIYSRARKLAKKYGNDPEKIAERLGIKVIRLPMESIKGAAISLKRFKLIFVNSNLTPIEQKIVIGHEIGHFLLHPSTNYVFIQQHTFFQDKHEYQANMFACELILGEVAEKNRQVLANLCAWGRIREIAEFIDSVINQV